MLMWAVCILFAVIIVKIFDVFTHPNSDSEQRQLSGINSAVTDQVTRYQYVRFNNLVIKSGGNTTYTEIDSVIVSPYGIFCVEEKAHVGYIFGSRDKEYWTQCKYTERVKLYNPLRQNYKHVQALNNLLSGQLRAPIHSYVLFSKAKIVEVDSTDVFSSWSALQNKIDNHTRMMYTLDEYEEILRTLAVASSRSAELLPAHIDEVSAYLKQKALV